MMRKVALAALVFTMGTVAAFAADFNGKWTGDVETPMGTQTVTFDFHVDGSKLTGKVTSPMSEDALSEGKVDGDNISFTQVVHFNDNELKIVYTGKADGDTIKFTRQVGEFPSSDFAAKRGAAAAPAPPPQ
jgi:hypothetical protein